MTSPAIVGLNVSRMPNSLNCDGDAAARALHDRHRKLAAGEKARFLVVIRDEVRLREALKLPRALERPDQRADVVLRIQKEEIQEVAERQLA